MIIDKCCAMQLYSRLLICFAFIVISLRSYGQINTDSLYKDIDLTGFKPLRPAVPQNLYKGGFYIRNIIPNKRSKETIELIKVYRDSSTDSRKAKVVKLDYGDVLAFKVLKSPGYEKVIIFADWDYYYDSLLVRQDTLLFKEMADDAVELVTVYPPKNDTLTIKYGHRNTRYDFLKKFSYKPTLKNYNRWFPDSALDYLETYTLVKKDSTYELVKIETNRDTLKEYEYEAIKEKFARAGLSLFWLALTELAY